MVKACNEIIPKPARAETICTAHTYINCHLSAEPLCVTDRRNALQGLPNVGALVEFSGHVRQSGDLSNVQALEIDYYAPMTEAALKALAERAARTWSVRGIYIAHRVGTVPLGGLIVWVGVASEHRLEAFTAASFIMDRLKTDVPFWKKEIDTDGQSRWVRQKQSDTEASRAHEHCEEHDLLVTTQNCYS